MLVNDITVMSSECNSQLVLRIKFPTECVFQIFDVLKINRIMPICNLFLEQPSYMMH